MDTSHQKTSIVSTVVEVSTLLAIYFADTNMKYFMDFNVWNLFVLQRSRHVQKNRNKKNLNEKTTQVVSTVLLNTDWGRGH